MDRLNRCVMCKHEGLVTSETEDEITLGRRRFVATVPALACPACGETYVTAADLGRFELDVARSLVESGDDSGEAFRFMRKVAGLSAVELASLLAVTPETVSRWEHGKLTVERRALGLVGAMVADRAAGTTATRDRLKVLAGRRKKLPRVVRLGSLSPATPPQRRPKHSTHRPVKGRTWVTFARPGGPCARVAPT